jgi:hypothetical protein
MRLFRTATRQDVLPVVILLCWAILVRAMIPIGLMPDLAALKEGRIVLVACHGDGAATNDSGGNTKEEQQNSCVFASFSHGKMVAGTQFAEGGIGASLASCVCPIARLPLVEPVYNASLPVGARAPPDRFV